MHIDDLNVGDLFAVIQSDCAPDEPVQYDGIPYRVAAISLPFVVATSPSGKTISFDTRVMKIVRVSRQYAKAFSNARQVRRRKERKEPECDGYARCVRCGDRLVQRQDLHTRSWFWACRQCDAQYAMD